ncbi:hypothetical protein Trydic_g6677 [Trypoxylus dichotomus]
MLELSRPLRRFSEKVVEEMHTTIGEKPLEVVGIEEEERIPEEETTCVKYREAKVSQSFIHAAIVKVGRSNKHMCT